MSRFEELKIDKIKDMAENWDPCLSLEENMRDNKIVLVIRSNYGIRPDEINPMYWGEYLNIIDEELFVPFPDMGHYIQLESFSSICPKTGHINELEYNDSNEKWSWKPL
jgi:hypothetical protein